MINGGIRKLLFVLYATVGLLCLSLLIEVTTWFGYRNLGAATPAQLTETLSHTFVLAILLALVVFIFRPAVRQLRSLYDHLSGREEQLTRVLSTAVEGYAVIDPETYVYQNVNNALCSMLGYTREEMLGKTPMDFCAPESQKIIRAQASTIGQTSDRQYQVVMRHKDGHNVYTQYNANTVYDDTGKAVSAFAFITNITNVKNTQLALKDAKEKAEQATELKDKFVSLIAHDLRNPIGAIRGYTELMLMDMKETLEDDQKEALGYIYNQCNDLLELINDLLDLSRLQTGQVDVDSQFLDAHFVVDNIISRVSMQASSKDIVVLNDVPIHTRIFADHVLYGQVLQNLISNAIKFSHTNSEIRVFVSDDGQPTAIAVQDSGVGMTDSVMDMLFSLEEKQSTLGTAGESGSGFGLPLSRQIMQAHHGDIRVVSEPGRGSTFYAALPLVEPHVLVIEPDADIRDTLRTLLEGTGAHVHEAGTLSAGIDKIKKHGKPNLLITEACSPEMGGVEALRLLKTVMDGDICPIIVLSGEDDEGAREQCLGLGASDFTQKPIQPHDLMPRVRQFIA